MISVLASPAFASEGSDSGPAVASTGKVIADDLFGVTHQGSERIWASGYYGTIVRSTDAGRTWARHSIAGAQLLRRILFTNNLAGYAVGHRGSVFSTNDGGEAWSQLILEQGLYLRSLDFFSEKEGWVVGHNASIFHTLDGGEHWVRQALSNYEGRDLPRLNDVVAVSEKTAIAVGEFGILALTTDGGNHWYVSNAPTRSTLTAVDEAAGVIVAVGLDGTAALLELTEDQKISSRALPTGTQEHLFDISLGPDGNGYAVGRAVSLRFQGTSFRETEIVENYQDRSSWLGGVTVLPNGVGYAVGSGGAVLRIEKSSKQFVVVHRIGNVALDTEEVSK